MLFENTPSGVMVTTDEQLEHHIEIAAKKCHETEDKEKIVKKAKKRAKTYTRAIGRIMLHALANKQTLPTNAMPPFLINCESVTVSSTMLYISHYHSNINIGFPLLSDVSRI